ncbi:TPA: hypothetical protein PIU23_005285 [Klebsiella quasipneumoniae subsp. similipneumoniae]|nr:hypothetical protein [Klebsiella quasipneumoniae]SXD53005.1 Uncharacterised protein [Klebsiella quasipneumoniae]HCT6262471.1 hypothetical protein [Klebsiella quasipneumoniae]HDH1381967.1 hypothetical protein [Klebsiella quasipneumoniae subsp. similipneumoniae]
MTTIIIGIIAFGGLFTADYVKFKLLDKRLKIVEAKLGLNEQTKTS